MNGPALLLEVIEKLAGLAAEAYKVKASHEDIVNALRAELERALVAVSSLDKTHAVNREEAEKILSRADDTKPNPTGEK